MRGRGKYKHLNEGDRLPRSFKTAPGLGPRKKSLRNTDMEELEAMHQAALKGTVLGRSWRNRSLRADGDVGAVMTQTATPTVAQKATPISLEELTAALESADAEGATAMAAVKGQRGGEGHGAAGVHAIIDPCDI